MPHYLLFYDVADDYLARRGDFRDEHLAKAWAAEGAGHLVTRWRIREWTTGAGAGAVMPVRP